MIAPARARNCVVALCVFFCHLRALNSLPAAPPTTTPPSRVTVNYNMNCTIGTNFRLQTTDAPHPNRSPFSPRPKRLRQRSTFDDRIPAPTQPVEFSVMLHNNGTSSRRHVELYIHPRVEGSVYQPAIEPAPIALEVARFGKCEDYNQFLMEPICNKLGNLSSDELSKLRPYMSQCTDQPTLQNPRNIVHSIFALHNTRLDRYVCITKNGTAYASGTLKAECFVFIRQLTDSVAEARETRPTCSIESKHMRRSGIIEQVRASDYYLIMSAIYPKLISNNSAECRIEKKGVVKFGGADRWVMGVSHSSVQVVHQKRISLNTLWNFDVVTPGPDRNIPLVQRPTTRPASTSNTTSTTTSLQTTAGTTRASARRLGDNNRREGSLNRVSVDLHEPLGSLQQLVLSFPGSRPFLEELLRINGTFDFSATDEKIKPGIADAVNNRQRNARHRYVNKS